MFARARRAPRVRRALVTIALALSTAVTGAGAASAEESWATARARENVHQGRQALARGDAQRAVQDFVAALQVDATYGDAYLELGKLRESLGDPKEAARVYAMALEHIPGFTEAHLARSALFTRNGQRAEAFDDLRRALEQRPRDLAVLGTMVETSIRFKALPQALGFTRRRKAIALAEGNEQVHREALVTELALVRLLDEVDPVVAGKNEHGVRALLAKRAVETKRATPPRR